MNKKFKSGFTLIEVLIVVAIIGILSTLVLVGLGNVRPGARDARRLQDLKEIQNTLEIYNTKYGHYPAALTDLSDVGGATLPKDPADGSSYTYAPDPAPAQHYVLSADHMEAALATDKIYQGSSCSGSAPGKYCVGL